MTWLDLYIRVGALGGNVFFFFFVMFVIVKFVSYAKRIKVDKDD